MKILKIALILIVVVCGNSFGQITPSRTPVEREIDKLADIVQKSYVSIADKDHPVLLFSIKISLLDGGTMAIVKIEPL